MTLNTICCCPIISFLRNKWQHDNPLMNVLLPISNYALAQSNRLFFATFFLLRANHSMFLYIFKLEHKIEREDIFIDMIEVNE